jgi:hypothetical protein
LNVDAHPSFLSRRKSFRSWFDVLTRPSHPHPPQVVVWDAVISDKEQAWIRSDFVVNKYSLTDQGYGLRDNNVTLVMNWNTVPATGLLTLSHAFDQVHRFQVPTTYS